MHVAIDGRLLASPTDADALAAALERLISDSEFASSLRERGFQQVRQFSWDTAAQKTLHAYRCAAQA